MSDFMKPTYIICDEPEPFELMDGSFIPRDRYFRDVLYYGDNTLLDKPDSLFLEIV